MLRRITCCTLLLLAVHASAQDRMPPPKGPPMDEIAQSIGLKDSQRSSVQAALEQHHTAMMALHDSMRSKHDALDQQLHTSLAKVLTPEQLSRFDQWQQTHRPPPPDGPGGQAEHRGPPGGQGGPGGGPGINGGQGGFNGPGGQGQRPPPPQGGQYGQGNRPLPPGGDENSPTPPPPGA